MTKSNALPYVCCRPATNIPTLKCFNVDRKLQECLHEHGGGEVGQIWFDGDVPLFLVNFHTKLALRKLLAGQSVVEKKLMTKLQSTLICAEGCLKPLTIVRSAYFCKNACYVVSAAIYGLIKIPHSVISQPEYVVATWYVFLR